MGVVITSEWPADASRIVIGWPTMRRNKTLEEQGRGHLHISIQGQKTYV